MRSEDGREKIEKKMLRAWEGVLGEWWMGGGGGARGGRGEGADEDGGEAQGEDQGAEVERKLAAWLDEDMEGMWREVEVWA